MLRKVLGAGRQDLPLNCVMKLRIGEGPRTRASALAAPGNGTTMISTCAVVGRIFKANAAPIVTPWMWTLAFGHHEDRSPTHGYAATSESAMGAFAKSWRRL